MKKYFRLFSAIAVAALALTGCNKNESPVLAEQESHVVRFSALPDNTSTKSLFGEKEGTAYPTLWTADSKVKIAMNYANQKDATVEPSEDKKSASFEASFDAGSATAFKFMALSPSSAYVGLTGENKSGIFNSWNINFPASQTPLEGSVDEQAHILTALSKEYTAMPSSNVDFQFKHVAAYGKFNLKNLDASATVESIDLVSDEPFAGRFYYYIEDNGTNQAGDCIAQASATTTISLSTDRTEDIWFSCAPVNLQGKKLKFVVNTDKGQYIKEVTFPADKGNFQAGRVATFNVDMSGIAPAEDVIYTLVTDYSELTEDSEVIIVAANADLAVGTGQTGNNRAEAAVIREMSETHASTVKNPSDAVQVFILEAGTTDNTISFKCLNGTNTGKYIGAAENKNYLRSFDATGDNTSFSVELYEDYATIKDKQYGRILKHNNNEGNGKLFACYTSGQQDVAIYKKNGSGIDGELLIKEQCATPTISFDAATNTVTIETTTTGGTIYYTTDGATPTTSSNVYSAPFTITENCTVKAFVTKSNAFDSEVASKSCTISSGSAVTYTLDSEAIVAAHSSAWQYTSGEKTITATDGSKWICYNTFGAKDQPTVQTNKDKGCYILTPDCGDKKITNIKMELTSDKDGNGTGTRGLVLNSDGNSTSVSAADLISGYTVTGSYSQWRIENNSGAVYIKSITITAE